MLDPQYPFLKPSESTTDVLIVGAGPAGLVAALVLAKMDINVVLVDRRYGLVVELYNSSLKFPGCQVRHLVKLMEFNHEC